MAFPADVIKLGVKIASTVTKGVQCKVTLYQWTGKDGFGNLTYSTPLTPRCILDRTNKVIQLGNQMVSVSATLTFLDSIPANGAAGRREPIDPNDKIVLPDGFTAPIKDAPGSVINPETGQGFVNQVFLGR